MRGPNNPGTRGSFPMPPSLMFIAGDPSGDHHASQVVHAVRAAIPDAKLWGIGGPSMEAEGFELLMPFAPFNRMGFIEVAIHIRFFLKAKKQLIDIMEKRRPDVLVCVDYSGFNIPMMKAAHAVGIPVVWYIAPMVWAWHKERAQILGEHAAHIAVIFPFEVPYFAPYAAPVSFVGNPTVEAMEREGAFAKALRSHPGKDAFRLALVPGSRRQEVEKLLPPMMEALSILRNRYPGLRAVLSRFKGLPADLYRKAIGGADVELFDGPLREMLSRADAAIVTSGTATLETALLGVPHVIAYRTSFITYAFAKRVLKIPHIGLPNIIAGEEVAPECLQKQAEGPALAARIEAFIDSPEYYTATAGKLMALRQRLGEKRPSEEVCGIIKGIIGKK
jgi:lipid-A-disaccharide synthase